MKDDSFPIIIYVLVAIFAIVSMIILSQVTFPILNQNLNPQITKDFFIGSFIILAHIITPTTPMIVHMLLNWNK